MSNLRIAFALAAFVCAAGFAPADAQQSAAHPSQRRARHQHTHHAATQPKLTSAQQKTAAAQAEKPAPKQALATVPLAPPPPQSSLVVAYKDGALAITAQDATLREIFEEIHNSTGAVIESPALDQRVSARLAPQPPADVIAALLAGTHLNYAILGGSSDRDPIQRIIVTAIPTPGPQSPGPDQNAALVEAAVKARARAQLHFAEETGGDEGVWDNAPRSSPQSRDPNPPPATSLAHQ